MSAVCGIVPSGAFCQRRPVYFPAGSYLPKLRDRVVLETAIRDALASGRVPVVARFALAGSEPYVHDAFGIVRSMVLLFLLRDGEQSDLQQRLPKWQCTR